MNWLKTWLMKWLGVDELRAENAELILRLDAFAASERKFSDLVWTEINKRDQKITELEKQLRHELIDAVKFSERDAQRIAELEKLVKDATIDTTLEAIEARVSKLESTPSATPSHGRRGSSAWASHQVAASAGAARVNGVDVPIPTPGIS